MLLLLVVLLLLLLNNCFTINIYVMKKLLFIFLVLTILTGFVACVSHLRANSLDYNGSIGRDTIHSNY